MHLLNTLLNTLSHLLNTFMHLLNTLSHLLNALMHLLNTLRCLLNTLMHLLNTLVLLLNTNQLVVYKNLQHRKLLAIYGRSTEITLADETVQHYNCCDHELLFKKTAETALQNHNNVMRLNHVTI